MIVPLPDDEVEKLLNEQVVGRIGCHADGRTYVVPVAYAYVGGSVYAHSTNGAKIRMMRKNPRVCFEVDRVETLSNWKSVIAWGTYEELQDEAAREAMRMLLLHFLNQKAHPLAHSFAPDRPGISDRDAIVYRIRLTEKTGRAEQPIAV
ncbi:MAG TPA: pyridoxamine 5'-phosphate oxidase family protein [Candidatus Rubrimentiphilum sp.]|nr:pyridoxamine 5'-phosphate oxidase family protein [Candidatus Rubrimentiphilum sp.]